jgi:ADP-ribose pyrophosphatase
MLSKKLIVWLKKRSNPFKKRQRYLVLQITEKKTVFTTPIFDIEELTLTIAPGIELKERFRIKCSNWANILPITRDGKAVLVKQTRFGSMEKTLETPGGVIDSSDRDPMLAALRELEEETGYMSKEVLSLGAFNPNPAIMTNDIFFFLALNCYLEPKRTRFQDREEDIEIHLVDPENLDFLVRTSRIKHALSALCIQLAMKYIKHHQ